MLAKDITRPFDLKGAPQIAGPKTTRTIMRDVLIALTPACVASVVIFGLDAAIVLALSVLCCVGFEYLWCRFRKVDQTVFDLSAAVTGVLLAMNCPATLPVPMVVVGAFVAIIVAKELFGGIGRNIANPAIVGRIFLALSFPAAMATFEVPRLVVGNADLVSSATPLAPSAATPTLMQLLLGTHAGTLGETCSVALILGMSYLIVTRTIRWEMPATYLGAICVLSAVCGRNPLVEILEGGILLGAGFMVTDYTTSPHTIGGKVVFCLGCALSTCLIRFFGNLNEGVAYSILFMNLLVPHIDRVFVNVPLGTESARKNKRKGGE